MDPEIGHTCHPDLVKFRTLAAAGGIAVLSAAGCSSVPASDGKHATDSPSPRPSYLHPVKDLYWVKSGCDSEEGEPGITFWLRNHAAHAMAYDIKYDFIGATGKVVGSVEGVFSVAPHQTLGDEALYASRGHCGPSFRLAYVNAYDNTKDGADQPNF